MNQDSSAPVEVLGRQFLQVQAASLALADQMILLGLAAQAAAFDVWMRPALQAAEVYEERIDERARTARLVRRGVPASEARKGLRML